MERDNSQGGPAIRELASPLYTGSNEKEQNKGSLHDKERDN